MNFEATDLCLGLPGRGGQRNDYEDLQMKSNGSKRGFSETEAVDLKLNLSNSSVSSKVESKVLEKVAPLRDSDYSKPPAKAQVVGWPPVRSYRKNAFAVQKPSTKEDVSQKTAAASSAANGLAFVKVSMDGAPYLRKVDLKMYKSYQELSNALAKMFGSFISENCEGAKDFMGESKLVDLLDGSEHVSTYEDKDGDWMLVGDVPWGMFVESCKRVRIMKGSEATGLGPRAVEKCKSRS